MSQPRPPSRYGLHVRFANYAINPFSAAEKPKWSQQQQQQQQWLSVDAGSLWQGTGRWRRGRGGSRSKWCVCTKIVRFLTLNGRKQANLFHKFAQWLNSTRLRDRVASGHSAQCLFPPYSPLTSCFSVYLLLPPAPFTSSLPLATQLIAARSS